MTEEEREKLRQAKIDVSEKLASTEIGRYRLTEVDDRLDQYVREVAGNPDGHNLYEQLAVAHFFDMCDRYGVNVTEVLQFFDFYESLYFPGKVGQQRYKLTPVQAFQFASIFAVWSGRQFCMCRESSARPQARHHSLCTTCCTATLTQSVIQPPTAPTRQRSASMSSAAVCASSIRRKSAIW